MKKAWKRMKVLHKVGVHRRKGLLKDYTDTQILSRAAEEIVELMAEPDSKMEMADIFGCLIHYCVRKGWSIDDIQKRIIKKWNRRITNEQAD